MMSRQYTDNDGSTGYNDHGNADAYVQNTQHAQRAPLDEAGADTAQRRGQMRPPSLPPPSSASVSAAPAPASSPSLQGLLQRRTAWLQRQSRRKADIAQALVKVSQLYHSKAATTTRSSGQGLALALTQRNIEQHLSRDAKDGDRDRDRDRDSGVHDKGDAEGDDSGDVGVGTGRVSHHQGQQSHQFHPRRQPRESSQSSYSSSSERGPGVRSEQHGSQETGKETGKEIDRETDNGGRRAGAGEQFTGIGVEGSSGGGGGEGPAGAMHRGRDDRQRNTAIDADTEARSAAGRDLRQGVTGGVGRGGGGADVKSESRMHAVTPDSALKLNLADTDTVLDFNFNLKLDTSSEQEVRDSRLLIAQIQKKKKRIEELRHERIRLEMEIHKQLG